MAAHRYTLRRINWRKTNRNVGGGPAPDGNHGWHRLPGSVRVATFADPDDAEAERRRLEAEARAVVNPFRCGSTLDEGRLCDWLLDHGLEPPAENRDWVRWYDEGRAAMDDHQREKVWEALDGCASMRWSKGRCARWSSSPSKSPGTGPAGQAAVGNSPPSTRGET
jgi:hypothetical protein